MVSVGDMPWLAGIRAFENEIPDRSTFVDAWRTALGEWGISLREDGELLHSHRQIGRWALLEAGPATDAALADCDKGCPFVGRRLGALAFRVYTWSDPFSRTELILGLIKEGRDGIVHRHSGRKWPAIALQTRYVGSCLSKTSFDDGALLLTREDGSYASWTRETVMAPLLATGNEAGSWNVWWISTCHNPLRLVLANGQETLTPFEGADRVLSNTTVDLWLYDFDSLDELIDQDEHAPLWQE